MCCSRIAERGSSCAAAWSLMILTRASERQPVELSRYSLKRASLFGVGQVLFAAHVAAAAWGLRRQVKELSRSGSLHLGDDDGWAVLKWAMLSRKEYIHIMLWTRVVLLLVCSVGSDAISLAIRDGASHERDYTIYYDATCQRARAQ